MPEPQSDASRELGLRLQRFRTERTEFSQEHVAALAGMNGSNYGKIERGLGNPSFHTLLRIAGALGVDLDELLKGITKEMLPPRLETYSIDDYLRERRKRGLDER